MHPKNVGIHGSRLAFVCKSFLIPGLLLIVKYSVYRRLSSVQVFATDTVAALCFPVLPNCFCGAEHELGIVSLLSSVLVHVLGMYFLLSSCSFLLEEGEWSTFPLSAALSAAVGTSESKTYCIVLLKTDGVEHPNYCIDRGPTKICFYLLGFAVFFEK